MLSICINVTMSVGGCAQLVRTHYNDFGRDKNSDEVG